MSGISQCRLASDPLLVRVPEATTQLVVFFFFFSLDLDFMPACKKMRFFFQSTPHTASRFVTIWSRCDTQNSAHRCCMFSFQKSFNPFLIKSFVCEEFLSRSPHWDALCVLQLLWTSSPLGRGSTLCFTVVWRCPLTSPVHVVYSFTTSHLQANTDR